MGVNIKDNILGEVEDMVSNFLYYDRKESEDLPLGRIEQALNEGSITQDQIVDKFAKCLAERLLNG